MQRPDVARLVHHDLRAMAWLAPHLVGRIPVAALANPPALVELFADTIVEELDFRVEAANMLDVAGMLRELGQTGYVVPRPHPALVTRRVLVMQRLDGFKFDDVSGMREAGVDTEGVVRTAMIALMEGAMINGIFHGDLHGGNLLVLADGRTALLDFGIVGRLDDARRVAFLRLMVAATTNDLKGQMAALRDLGALPADTDLRAVIRDLGFDQAPVDPTTLTGDQLVKEVQRVMKGLLGYGARMPKELMLYVKNLVFLDAAIARLAPDLDILAEIANISVRFATRHGERLGRDLGFDVDESAIDMDGVKAGFGLDPSVERLTHRELQPAVRSSSNACARERRAVDSPCGSSSPAAPSTTTGGSTAHLPDAVRLIMVKADGCVAIHADGGAYKPLNWMNAPNQLAMTTTCGSSPTARASGSPSPSSRCCPTSARPRHRPRTAEGRRRGASPSAPRRQPAVIDDGLRLVRREYPTDIGPVDLSAAMSTAASWPSRSNGAVRSTVSSS